MTDDAIGRTLAMRDEVLQLVSGHGQPPEFALTALSDAYVQTIAASYGIDCRALENQELRCRLVDILCHQCHGAIRAHSMVAAANQLDPYKPKIKRSDVLFGGLVYDGHEEKLAERHGFLYFTEHDGQEEEVFQVGKEGAVCLVRDLEL